MADSGGDLELDAFRAEARAWLEENYPASLRGKPGLPGALMESGKPQGDVALWRERLASRGWGTPTWPSEYGGGGLTPMAARVLQQEMDRIGAFNALSIGMGISMVGPTILEYGTEDQKRRHIPPIVRGEVRWCLGYSEPGAGSDLASLQTRCEDAGDHWAINGQKIWTSGAQWSDWCGCLVRTDPEAKKHDGISFMLIDMHQPGVETRPIKLIAGASPFCETFFIDARAGKDDMLGALNNGWTVGKRLLQHERAGQTGAALGRATPLHEVATRYLGLDDHGRLAEPNLRGRLAAHEMSAKAHELTIARVQAESRGAPNPSPAASVLKNSATVVAQGRAELSIEIMGHDGLGWEGEGFTADEVEAVRTWLSSKSMSIYGGSFEIQNNIVSKRILGLPDMTKSA